MTKRTPLYDRHVALGGRIVDFAGYELPVRYSKLTEEHQAVRERVGLFDVSHMGEIRFRGPQATEALDFLLPNDIAGLEVGQARYSLMLHDHGGVVDDVLAYRFGPDDILVVVNAANRDKDFAHMKAKAEGFDVVVTDESDAWAQIAVQGPQGPATLAACTDTDLDSLGYYRFVEGTVAGVEGCVISRTGYTGEDGFEVYCASADAPKVWDALLAAGEPHGILPCGLGCRDTLRLEVRFPLYGHELTDELSPVAARSMWTVKLNKPGGFVGKEAVAQRKADKSDTHLLAGLKLIGKRIARDGMVVRSTEGEDIGWIASGTRSPTLDTSIATAFLKRGHGAPGSRVIIDVRGREAEAEIVKGPFVKKEH